MYDQWGRREIIRAGLGGFASLSLPDLLRMRSAIAAGGKRSTQNKKASSEKTAIILVWLRGGASHLETFDPKPDAPSTYRGPFSPISTNVPGTQICELLPQLATCADRYSIVRSLAHTGGGHPAGSLQMLSGDPDKQDKTKPRYPDWMSIANYLRFDSNKAIPNYIAVNPVDRYDSFTIAGPTYLGGSYAPFQVVGDPSKPGFTVPNIGHTDQKKIQRMHRRIELRKNLDSIRTEIDQQGLMDSMDRFEAQAMNLILSEQAREAFDLTQESQVTRERYGMNQWGQQCLMARRLVEAGVEIITTEFDGPLCGRVRNWDDHAVNHNVFDALQHRAPYFDQAVSALIEDVYARGLDKRVLVVVTGEFGRTPKISHVASSGGGVASAAKGTVQPGRDHWPRAGSMIFAGGGIQTGQIIGATDAKGEDPISRRIGPEDFLATIYRHLNIDYNHIAPTDFSGRPTPIIRKGKPIKELARQS